MANDPKLTVRIGGDTKGFDRAVKTLPATAKKGLTPLKLAAGAAALSFVALAAGANQAIQEFRLFEKEFSNVVTLLDDGSFKTKTLTEGINNLKDGVIDLRKTTGQSFDNLNKGLFDLISSGVNAEDAIEALTVATNLALAGSTNTSIAVDGLTTAMNAFGLEANQAQKISEKFFTAQKFGKTTIAELSTDLGKVAATASEMGVSFEEVLSSVSAATLAGINTNEAYTGLKAVFSNIIKPSKDAADEAKRLGINFDSMALKARGLPVFLDTITDSVNFNSTSMEKLFGSMEAVNIILALTGGQAGSFKDILKELDDELNRSGTFTDALNEKNETLDQKLLKLEGSASALRTEIGERLTPAFGTFVDAAIIGLDSVNENMDILVSTAMSLTEALAQMAGVNLKPLDEFTKIDFGGEQTTAFEFQLEQARLMSEGVLEELNKINEAEAKLEEERIARAEIKAEKEDEIFAQQEEKEKEKREIQLEREDEQFEQDIERLNEHLSGKEKTEAMFDGLKDLRLAKELKSKAKTDKQKEEGEKVFRKAEGDLGNKALASSLERLGMLVNEESAAGKAIFFIKKAQAISSAIVHTSEAVTEALPNFPLAAAVGIAGGLQIATIAGTAFQGAVDGGIVQGGSFGVDTQPFLLARDEIIVPSRLNPLSPNFEETFDSGGLGGIGGQQSVNVEISLTDDASRFITAGQREDNNLGV